MTDVDRDALPSSDRLEMFSDGVLAIAITLLIIEVLVPRAGRQGLWHALAQEWPSYVAYLVSFLTIGIMWVNHHARSRVGGFKKLRMSPAPSSTPITPKTTRTHLALLSSESTPETINPAPARSIASAALQSSILGVSTGFLRRSTEYPVSAK